MYQQQNVIRFQFYKWLASICEVKGLDSAVSFLQKERKNYSINLPTFSCWLFQNNSETVIVVNLTLFNSIADTHYRHPCQK